MVPVEPSEPQLLGRAVDGYRRLAAAHAGAVLVVAARHAAGVGRPGGGAEGGAAANDVGVVVVLEQSRLHVAAREDELVDARQRVGRSAAAGEAVAVGEVPVLNGSVAGQGADVYRGAGVDDAHGAVPEGDLGDPKHGVVAEEEPRGVAGVVAGEVEPWPEARGRTHAERVRHAHAAAAGLAARHPDRRPGTSGAGKRQHQCRCRCDDRYS